MRIQKHFAELQAKVTTCHESITLAQHHPELLQVNGCQKSIYGRTKLLAGTGSKLPHRDHWGYKLTSSLPLSSQDSELPVISFHMMCIQNFSSLFNFAEREHD